MSSCKNSKQMAIPLAAIGAGLGALQQSKIDRALSGDKEYTKPKTIFGKLIGGISGRSAAAEATAQTKTAPISSAVMNSLQPSSSNLDPNIRQSFPLTGGVQFGTQAKSRPWLPYAIVGAIVAIFYFMRGKKGRRRR
jgi:hypothetical protein